jgi:hypothetical protein
VVFVKVLAENLISATISMLYKRAFRKEKEVTTFLELG